MHDLARRLRDALRVPAITPEFIGWLVLAGVLAACLPSLMESMP